MRQFLIVVAGLLVIAAEVLLGVRAFFPEYLEKSQDVADDIVVSKKSILDKAAPEDLAWASGSEVITVGVDPNFYPLEMFDERGRYSGLGGDYLRLLAKMTGLNFKPVKATDWAAVEEQARNGEIDIFMAAAKTGKRSGYMSFTPPYVTLPGVIMTRKDSGLKNIGIDDLKNKKVAVVRDYSWHDYLQEFKPEITALPAKDTAEALQMVVSGKADAVLDYEFNLLEKIQTGGILQLQTAGDVNSTYGHAIAVQKNKPELFSLTSMALEQITPQERKILAEKWLNQGRPAGEERRLQWMFFFFVQAVLVCMGINLLVDQQARRMTLETIRRLCQSAEKIENGV